MTTPFWVTGMKGEPQVKESLLLTFAQRIAQHEARCAKDAKDWGDVLLARGAIQELEYLKRMVEAEEKEDAARGVFESRSGTRRAGNGANG